MLWVFFVDVTADLSDGVTPLRERFCPEIKPSERLPFISPNSGKPIRTSPPFLRPEPPSRSPEKRKASVCSSDRIRRPDLLSSLKNATVPYSGRPLSFSEMALEVFSPEGSIPKPLRPLLFPPLSGMETNPPPLSS